MHRLSLTILVVIGLVAGCSSDAPPPEQANETSDSQQSTETMAAAAPEPVSEPDDGANWANYNRKLNGTRYSPLSQVSRDNVGELSMAWSHAANGQTTPIVVDGVMYMPAESTVVAVEAHTGNTIWTFELPEGRPSNRGVSYWPGDDAHGPRIIFMAMNKMYALDAASGEAITDFGENGAADVGVSYWSVPTIFENVVMIGANTGELPRGAAGNPRAFDAVTGDKIWEFNTVPQPGEVGHETWEGDSWQERSGTNVWAFSMTVDEQRGVLYMPVAGAAPNYYGGGRPGNNLFANSVVAVDARTGDYIWHFQTVHHGLWDADQPSPPALLDIEVDGETIPALAIVGKTSYMFILNRETGEPIHGVEERLVPQGDVPGEYYSPTQPFPVKPEPLSRVSFAPEDMVTADDTTAEHVAACQDLWDRSGGMRNEGPFTPFLFKKEDEAPRTTVQFPGGIGGVNWGGVAADPNSGFVFANAHDTSLIGWLEAKKEGLNYGRGTEGSDQPFDRASVLGPGPYAGFNAPIHDANGDVVGMAPCQKPPWAHLVAVNANTGEIAWKTVLGLNTSLPEGKQNVGGAGSAGPTVTGGGLVFIGATNDRRFRAFDSATGQELWSVQMEQTGNANPMTYLGSDGKQYVAIVSRDKVLTYTLP